MDKKNYLMELRDSYIDKPHKVLGRFFVFLLIILSIHFLIGGGHYVVVAVGATVCFLVALTSAVLINKKWPRTDFD